ncbi:MAG: TetR/AcrR family transcriptional regulator, partial [Thermoleophilaceae bacterium]|nr:TetR/AcrR family transcriptional regulator [Thermoleophilaceae bacterium]
MSYTTLITTVATEKLPRGPHRLAREEVLASQRGRILEGMAEAVAAKGYAATTVAHVVARAGVSRQTFYAQFADKEDCFLAAYEVAVDLITGLVEQAEEGAGDWLARVRAGVHAYLETLAAEPAFARTYLVEVNAAGPRALDRRAEVMDRFASRHRESYARAREELAELPPLPDAVFDGLMGASVELVARHVRDGRIGELEELEPVLDDLLARDFLTRESRSTISGERSFRFKHVLIRDVAYAGLAKA